MLNSLSQEELDFVKAIEDYKKKKKQNFLSWTEVLNIVKDLGYVRSEQQRQKRLAAKAKRKSRAKAKTKS